jgi:hypothetical protein
VNAPAERAGEVDPRYVEARRILLDALTALAPHGAAVIVAGAQAVYLQTGEADMAVAPYTTDADLALDPTLLGDAPELEAAMSGAGFRLSEIGGNVEPGIWVASGRVEGAEMLIPVARAFRVGMPEERVEALCTAYTAQLLQSARGDGS